MNLPREAGNITLPDAPEPEMTTADKWAVFALAIVSTCAGIAALALLIEFAANY